MDQNVSSYFYHKLATRQPQAAAYLHGSENFPEIDGTVTFLQTAAGVMVTATVGGLPVGRSRSRCDSPIFALHIHEGKSCTGTADNPFANAGEHFNPNRCQHPHHAGDLPPLFSNGGFAWYSFLTSRFSIEDILGQTVIVHRNRDDFTTQPSGDPGAMIACGVIQRT